MSSSDGSEEDQSPTTCSVCKRSFDSVLERASVTPCEHVFCSGCLLRSAIGDRKCPTCSQPYVAVKRTFRTADADGTASSSKRRRRDTEETVEDLSVNARVLPVTAGAMNGSARMRVATDASTVLQPPGLATWADEASQGTQSVYLALGIPPMREGDAPRLVEQSFRAAPADSDHSDDVPTTPESPDVRDFMGLLGATIRQYILDPDARVPSMPVRDYPGFLDRALNDPSAKCWAMHRFFGPNRRINGYWI